MRRPLAYSLPYERRRAKRAYCEPFGDKGSCEQPFFTPSDRPNEPTGIMSSMGRRHALLLSHSGGALMGRGGGRGGGGGSSHSSSRGTTSGRGGSGSSRSFSSSTRSAGSFSSSSRTHRGGGNPGGFGSSRNTSRPVSGYGGRPTYGGPAPMPPRPRPFYGGYRRSRPVIFYGGSGGGYTGGATGAAVASPRSWCFLSSLPCWRCWDIRARGPLAPRIVARRTAACSR